MSQAYKGASAYNENTEWFTIVCWDKRAEAMNQYLAKGARVYVEGRLQSHQWGANNGETRFENQIIASQVLFLDRGNGKSTKDSGPESVGGAARADDLP